MAQHQYSNANAYQCNSVQFNIYSISIVVMVRRISDPISIGKYRPISYHMLVFADLCTAKEQGIPDGTSNYITHINQYNKEGEVDIINFLIVGLLNVS